MQEQEKEIFQSYEIKNWDYSPYLYKILGAAAVFNILTVLVLAQTDVLTARGCDSPFVGRVCQVIDTIYVGSTLLGTDSEFVSKDYEKSVLEDAEITYIDVSGMSEPLAYPAGYFALANPNDFSSMQNMTTDYSMPQSGIPGIPGFPTNPTITGGTDLMNTPPVMPTPNNNAVQGNIPTSPFMTGDNPIPAYPTIRNRKFPTNIKRNSLKNKNNSPNVLPPLPGETVAENTNKKDKDKDKTNEIEQPKPEIKSDPVAEVEINRKPFEDLGDFVNEELAKKQIDLNKPFKVVMEGTITADGKLDPKKSKFIKVEGDEKMKEVARQAIEAVGNSGFLVYLKNSGVDKVTFTLVQDDKQINAIIISDQKTPEKAGTTASGLNTMLSALKFADANGLKKLDDNSKTLIENSKVTNDGRNFVLNFALPKQNAQDIINKTLKDRAEKRAVQQPKSSAEINSDSKTALAK
ncbi:MAG: hypothetical protein LH614_16675 [Pyrinomonadaceae bacterium]|nr:hypothetical protein [Pyrinomonadaceae bacterium]